LNLVVTEQHLKHSFTLITTIVFLLTFVVEVPRTQFCFAQESATRSQETPAKLNSLESVDDNDIEPKSRLKRVDLQTILNNKVVDGTQDLVLDLGEQLCGDTVIVSWWIENPLGHSIDLPRATSSCGCITDLPSKLLIAAESSLEGKQHNPLENAKTRAAFKVSLPRQPEQIYKHVTFWDSNGNAKLHLTVQARVSPVISLETSHALVTNESQRSLRIPFVTQVEILDTTAFQCSAIGLEVQKSRVEWQGPNAGEVILEIDPKRAPLEVTQSSVELELIYYQKSGGVIPFSILYPNRLVVIPKTPTLTNENGSYRCKFLIRSAPLVEALRQSKVMKASVLGSHGHKLDTQVDVKAIASTVSSNTIIVDIRIDKGLSSHAQELVTLFFVSDNWKQAVNFRRAQ
jgi:hypothetical protein